MTKTKTDSNELSIHQHQESDCKTWTLDWTRGLTHCGHYAVAITFLSIIRPFPDEKFNEHHLCHIVEHILPSICLEVCEQFT